MATQFVSIFDKFTPMITDATLLLDEFTIDEASLSHYLNLAVQITLISVPLTLKSKLETIDIIANEFTTDLTIQEEYIVASAMRPHWIQPFISDTDYLLTATGGTRDYSEGSHANLLEKMVNLKKEYEEEIDGVLIAYSIDNGELSGLA